MEQQYRIEHDTMGEVRVPADKYWGAQTQRSLQNFRIGAEKIPYEMVQSFAVLKKAAAAANVRLGMLDEERGDIIMKVCDEILEGRLCCIILSGQENLLCRVEQKLNFLLLASGEGLV